MLNQPLFAALDVSLETTTICIMSFDGTITKEAVVATEPDSIAICLGDNLTKRAKVALARKLGVVLHRMWVDESEFRFGNPAQA